MRPTKLLSCLLLLPCLLGCRSYIYSRSSPDGSTHTLKIRAWASDARLGSLELQVESNVVLRVTGYAQDADEKLVQGVAAGVSEGVAKALLSKP